MIRTLFALGVALFFAAGAVHGRQGATPKPLRLAIAGLTHGHVGGAFARFKAGGVEIVGIYEPDREVVARYAKQVGFDEKLVYSDLGAMLDAVKPEAVAAFGPTSDHLMVVKAAAPRKIDVMVEKPLCLDAREAEEIVALAKRYGVRVLTNYETTWYPSTAAVYDLVDGKQALGPIRKIVVRDGHQGPKEIGVQPEFLDWLTDPKRNGAGALMDFGCYGANLATWLMHGQQPLTVTATTLHIKPDVYPRVEDEATIVLTYPGAQAILEASWNWPYGRKDMDVYGKTGSVRALDAKNLRIREEKDAEERTVVLDPKKAPVDEPFRYLTAVVRGEIKLEPGDLSSLENNVTVMKILDAARESARTGTTIKLPDMSGRRVRPY